MKKKLLNLAFIFLMAGAVGLFAVVFSQAATITVDGNISDWCSISALGTDSDDNSNPNADLKAAHATNDSNYLYLRLDVYGNINPEECWYYVYFDTDQDASTGFNAGWWGIGADYRIYIDKETNCIQKFMGLSQDNDAWGWDGELNSVKVINMAYGFGVLECAVLRKDIEETNVSESTDILWAAWPKHDSIPRHGDMPITYNYSPLKSQ